MGGPAMSRSVPPCTGSIPVTRRPAPPGTSRAVFHRPRAYRYRAADPGLRIVLNRYPGAVIGVAMVAGRYAYCVKWADAKVRLS